MLQSKKIERLNRNWEKNKLEQKNLLIGKMKILWLFWEDIIVVSKTTIISSFCYFLI